MPQENTNTYATLKALKIACLAYAESHFRGKSFKNKSSGHLIAVSKRGLNEWFSKSKSWEQIVSIRQLDSILENAAYSHAAENDKNFEKNAPSYEYYEYPIQIRGETYRAIISVRVISAGKDSSYIYYHHYLDTIEIKK